MKKVCTLLWLLGTVVAFSEAQAASLTQVRDLITTSAPLAAASHVIEFTVTNAVPASGSIVIIPQPSSLTIPSGFDHADVDLAISTSSGPYVDRLLAASANATNDGVAATLGAAGSITITLNSTEGIAAGDRVRITLGAAATSGVSGNTSLTTTSSVGSYRMGITTYTSGGTKIDSASAMFVVVEPVVGSVSPPPIPPVRSNGLPAGQIASGNPIIEISLTTNELATCRYATTTGVAYSAMTNTFTTIGGTIFYTVISGHQDNTAYSYYVRCRDNGGTVNDDDYEIAFSLEDTETGQSDPGTGTGGSTSNPNPSTGSGSGGPGGVGSIPGGSDVLYQASVAISGWASPGSSITILRDGKAGATTAAKIDGSFKSTINGLERGTYTFLMYAEDSKGRKSATRSATLTVGSGTNNSISNIVIPSTLALEKDSVEVGEDVLVSGETLMGSPVELSVIRQNNASLGDSKRFFATSTMGVAGKPDGSWEISIPGSELSRGTYEVKARTVTSTTTQTKSDYSRSVFLGVGEEASPDFGIRADINGDGKVNLVDFSIMLSFWTTSDTGSDINADGTVNLADFSILLFNWTG